MSMNDPPMGTGEIIYNPLLPRSPLAAATLSDLVWIAKVVPKSDTRSEKYTDRQMRRKGGDVDVSIPNGLLSRIAAFPAITKFLCLFEELINGLFTTLVLEVFE
jgi:hypothetical protein